WMADLDNRTVSALDDEARWITDEEAPPEPLRGRARLMSVKSSFYDLEAGGSFADESRCRRARGPQRGSGPVSSQHPAALGGCERRVLAPASGRRPSASACGVRSMHRAAWGRGRRRGAQRPPREVAGHAGTSTAPPIPTAPHGDAPTSRPGDPWSRGRARPPI